MLTKHFIRVVPGYRRFEGQELKRYRLGGCEYEKIERWDNLCLRLEKLGIHRSNGKLEDCIGVAVNELLVLRDEKERLAGGVFACVAQLSLSGVRGTSCGSGK